MASQWAAWSVFPFCSEIQSITLSSGLIKWKIVLHGFIDGYSRYVLGLRASDNNRAETVLRLFQSLVGVFGFPSRVRGDHGTENFSVARLQESVRGPNRGSYIFGRYVPAYILSETSNLTPH